VRLDFTRFIVPLHTLDTFHDERNKHPDFHERSDPKFIAAIPRPAVPL
jgi:hypothetical protein